MGTVVVEPGIGPRMVHLILSSFDVDSAPMDSGDVH
jgi:hypothetical protein